MWKIAVAIPGQSELDIRTEESHGDLMNALTELGYGLKNGSYDSVEFWWED